MLLVGEDLILHRQVDPRAVHEVEDGQVEFEGELLGPQVLLARDREPGAGLDGGVVGNHNASDAGHMADHQCAAASRTAAMLRVQAVAGQPANFQTGSAVVEKQIEPFLGGELALGVLFGNPLGSAPLARLLEPVVEFGELQLHRVHPALQFDFFRRYGHVRSLRVDPKVRPRVPVYF